MRLFQAIVFVAATLASEPANAHGLTPGPVGIYFAAEHILTEMPVPLALIAFGLLLGLNRHVAMTWAWLPLILGIVVGMAGILAWRLYIHPVLPLLLLTLIVALWAASGFRLPRSGAAILGVCIGYFLGVFIAPGPASWSMKAYAIIGGLTGVNLGVLSVFIIVALINERWSYSWIAISFRIVASWLAAIVAMVAALSLQ